MPPIGRLFRRAENSGAAESIPRRALPSLPPKKGVAPNDVDTPVEVAAPNPKDVAASGVPEARPPNDKELLLLPPFPPVNDDPNAGASSAAGTLAKARLVAVPEAVGSPDPIPKGVVGVDAEATPSKVKALLSPPLPPANADPNEDAGAGKGLAGGNLACPAGIDSSGVVGDCLAAAGAPKERLGCPERNPKAGVEVDAKARPPKVEALLSPPLPPPIADPNEDVGVAAVGGKFGRRVKPSARVAFLVGGDGSGALEPKARLVAVLESVGGPDPKPKAVVDVVPEAAPPKDKALVLLQLPPPLPLANVDPNVEDAGEAAAAAVSTAGDDGGPVAGAVKPRLLAVPGTLGVPPAKPKAVVAEVDPMERPPKGKPVPEPMPPLPPKPFANVDPINFAAEGRLLAG